MPRLRAHSPFPLLFESYCMEYIVQGLSYIWPSAFAAPRVRDRETGATIDEYVPPTQRLLLGMLHTTRLGQALMGSADGYVRPYLRDRTLRAARCDDPKSAAFIPVFVQQLRLDTSELDKNLEEFASLNEFFSRPLRPGARTLHLPLDPTAACQPCDARVVVFPTVESAARLWIKGGRFTVAALAGRGQLEDCGWSIAVARLAPQVRLASLRPSIVCRPIQRGARRVGLPSLSLAGRRRDRGLLGGRVRVFQRQAGGGHHRRRTRGTL